MKKLNIMLENELLTPRSGPVPHGDQKQFPINFSSLRNHVFLQRIILATTLAACAGLAHTALGQLSAADEVTETMMQAQVYDAFFLDMQYPFTSPLAVTYSVDPVGISFSYSLTSGQTINGASVSDSASGSGDYTSGSYAWSSSLAVGADNYATEYSAVWDPDTVSVSGNIVNSIKTLQWVVSGQATVTPDKTPPWLDDNGTVTMKLQYWSSDEKKWYDSGVTASGTISSTEYSPGGDWDITVNYTRSGGTKGTLTATWSTIPEPGVLDLLWTGAAGAWVASLLRARRPKITGKGVGSYN